MDQMFRNATATPPRAVTLDSGRSLAPGDDGPIPANPDDRAAHDQALIDNGDLIPVTHDGSDTGVPADDADLHGWLDKTTVADVRKAVGDDQAQAARVHAAEASRTKPRTSLLDQLAPGPAGETDPDHRQEN